MDATVERRAMERLNTLRVAKDLFLSDWYARSVEALFSQPTRETLVRIAEESRTERDDAFRLIEEWTQRLDGDPGRVRVVPALVARHFLDHLVEIKQSAAESFLTAGTLAPPELRERFYELAAVDVRHAMEIRRLVLDEFRDARDTVP